MTECSQTEPAWHRAVTLIQSQPQDELIPVLDKIISLCGEAQESWDARLMRASLHVQAQDYSPVAALMAPVPIPQPGSGGGYSGVVPMMAAYH